MFVKKNVFYAIKIRGSSLWNTKETSGKPEVS